MGVVVIARSLRGLAVVALALLACGEARAATGCDLNFPDRDVPRLVPGASRYTLSALSLSAAQLTAIAGKLDERYRALYEPLNVPYTVYEVFRGKERIGYVHGVNQKGQYGGIQLFVALDGSGAVGAAYIQKITGPSAAKLRDPALLKQLVGVRLQDFEAFDPVSGKGTGRLAALQNPAPDMETDFYGVLRALKKNLVLMEVLVYGPARQKP
jgi:hypothetical protein